MENIGKYKILTKIYTGRTCEVFKAEDTSLGQVVAIKMCLNSDEPERQYFFREAELGGRLNHPSITSVIGFGFEGSRPYLVLEFLTGETLYRKIEERQELSLQQRLLYLVDIARALLHIHQHNILHRNINPTNIQVLDNGSVKVMDFSIAKLIPKLSRPAISAHGQIIGTPPYMAPEQINNTPLDHRADIFCFGALAYELFTNERPFQYNGRLQTLDSTNQAAAMGQGLSTVIFRIMRSEPKPIREICPELPQPISELVAVCLAKDPQSRYAETSDLLRSLEAALQ